LQKNVGLRQLGDSVRNLSQICNLPVPIKIPERGSYNFKQIPLSDPRVWAVFGRGDTKGIFQLEKQLGQDWAKRAKPRNIEELAALVSILRPGPLESGMANQYVKRKNGEEETVYFHPMLEPILKETYGTLIYQEQAMRIAVELAGFNLVEADTLRKAIGKKKPEVMAEAKKMFLEKAKGFGKITEEEAAEIFSWIEKSVRYSFNKSHAVSYAMHAYYCAYQKVHFPREFYTAWLTYSDWKPDQKEEVYDLVQNAKRNGLNIIPPDILRMNVDFEIMPDGSIIFGLAHIRGVGYSAIETIKKYGENLTTLIGFLKSVKMLHRNVAEGLIKSGACDRYGISRTGLLKLLYIISGRTEGYSEEESELKPMTSIEYNHFVKEIDQRGIEGALYSILENDVCVKKRIPTIEAKIGYIKDLTPDTNRQKSIWEKIYLGLNLTCSAADDYEKTDRRTKTCREIFKLPPKEKVVMHVVIDKIKPRKTSEKAKNSGQPYCYLDVSDNTAAVSGIVCWPEQYEKYKKDLIEGLVVSIYGRKDAWKNKEQIVLEQLKVVG
jgi:DNA polymerase III alpha subunit